MTLIYGENEYVVRRALTNLAKDEYWSGYTDKRLWAKAITMTTGASKTLRPAISEDRVLNMNMLHPEELARRQGVLDRYCHIRGKEILAETQYRNATLKEEIKRVKAVHKLYIKHYLKLNYCILLWSPGQLLDQLTTD